MKLETQQLIARNLRILRTSKCLSQEKTSEMIGVARASYAAYELGKRVPDAEILFKIASRFGISVDDLFEEDKYRFLSCLERSDFYDDVLAELVASYRSLSTFARGMLLERAAWLIEWDKLIDANKKAFAEKRSQMINE